MDDSSGRDDGADSPRRLLSRRGMLWLTGTGIAGLAGCGGDDPAETTTGSPTATTTGTPTTTGTGTDTTTDSETETTPDPADLEPVQEATPDIVVAKDGSGDYESVQAAVDAAPDEQESETRVYIKNGRYKEKLRIPGSKTNLTFVGESVAETVLTYDDHADKPSDEGGTIGTSQSASVFIRPRDFTAQNITFENAAEPVAQAVAVYSDGAMSLFSNCRFLGNQDTLLTHGDGKREYYRDCYIEGDVDFIFGGKTAFFENCEIVCKPDGGYVTAPSTPGTADHGYVFRNCEVRAAEGTPDDSYYLGRPWRRYGQSVFLNCDLGDHVEPAGWIDSLSPQPSKETSVCAEYANSGPGYRPTQRVDWSYQLSEDAEREELRPGHYTFEKVFGDWNPRVSFGEGEEIEVHAGESAEVSATLRNLHADPLTDVDLSLSAPEGWSVTPVTKTTVDAIEPGDAPTVTWSVSPPTDARGAFSLTLSDDAGEFEATTSALVVTEGETAPMPYAINCGGRSSVTIDDVAYVPLRNPADRAYVSATSEEFGAYQGDPVAIGGTQNDALYWSENYGTDVSLAVDVENGTYDVTVYVAEIRGLSPGERVFSVSVQGERVLDHIDLAGALGPRSAYSRYASGVEVTDGTLRVSTTSHEGESKLSGVRIEEA